MPELLVGHVSLSIGRVIERRKIIVRVLLSVRFFFGLLHFLHWSITLVSWSKGVVDVRRELISMLL